MGGPQSQTPSSADRDSMVALDALLRIRESSGALDHSAAPAASNPSTSAHVAAPSLTHIFPSSLSSLLHQHAAMEASAAHYRLAAAQAAAATSWGNSLLAARTNAASHAPSRSGVGPTADAAATPQSSTPQDREERSASTTTREESYQEASVRKEKVDEALRSKPQRGRKREDLNDTERLELTRTRNREHAKSTRIRKKARYQELLDREENYLQMQEEENLEVGRRQCIQGFFEMRQSMLLDQVQRQTTTDQKADGEESSSQPKRKLEEEASQFPAKFAELVDTTIPFKFETFLPGGSNADNDDAFSKMIEWDEALLKRTNYSSEQSLKYEIESGPSGIALNKNGDAFCRVELCSQNSGKRKALLSGICAFTFGSQTNRLTSLKFTTLEDRCCVGFSMDSKGKQPSRQNLGSQLVHPSVVSLDQARHMHLDENHEQPGMSI